MASRPTPLSSSPKVNNGSGNVCNTAIPGVGTNPFVELNSWFGSGALIAVILKVNVPADTPSPGSYVSNASI